LGTDERIPKPATICSGHEGRGQMVGNLRHTHWFVNTVANWLIDNTRRWSQLEYV